MPQSTALPRYETAVAWSEKIPGIFTVGYSRIGGTDVLGEPYPKFGFDLPFDNLSARVENVEYQRGRSDDLTEMQALSGAITIRDDDEIYNPHNLDSPIAGQLNPLRPYRIKAVGPSLVPLTTNGWQIDDVVRGRTLIGDDFERALLRRKPLAYWRFSEATGTLEYADAGDDPDVLAYPQGVSVAEAPTFLAGDPGRAITLGTGSRLVVNQGDSVNPRAAIAVVALFKLTGSLPGSRYLLHKPGQWSLRIDGQGRLSFAYRGTDDTLTDLRSTVAVLVGVEYLATVDWDGKTIEMSITPIATATDVVWVDIERGLGNEVP